jgi:hypothetical protein
MAKKLLNRKAMTVCILPSRETAMSVASVQKSECVGHHRLEDLIHIVRGEFEEMPGMRLTRMQFRRLWHLSATDCEWLLGRLISSGFLAESDYGIGRPIDH